jgi:hypothetical protein
MVPPSISQEFIREKVAISEAMFKKGHRLYEYGAFASADCNPEKGTFVYDVDGSYGDYVTRVQFLEDGDLKCTCDCLCPGKGWKHAVAVLLNLRDWLRGWTPAVPGRKKPKPEEAPEPSPAAGDLTADEIRAAFESEAEELKTESERIAARSAPGGGHGRSGTAILAKQPPEKVEEVLNSGMSFIGGLLEMATGQRIQSTGPDDRMIQIDRETGEVTMKFKLPGF